MPEAHSWILTDVDHDLWVDSFHIDAEEVDDTGGCAWSISKRTLRGGHRDGVDLIEVSNGPLTYSIIPTRGMGIWRGRYKMLPIGWRSPVRGPVHPKFVNLRDRGELGWLSGFDELIVRCGLETTGAPGVDVIPNNMGVPTETPYSLHGRIANTPASFVQVQVVPGDPPELVIIGITYEASMFGANFKLTSRVSTTLGSNSFSIFDEVTNLRSTPAEMELLYHCNFGQPFLDRGAKLCIPAELAAPRDMHAAKEAAHCQTYQGPTTGFVEQCYWYKAKADATGNTVAMLRNAKGSNGVALRYRPNQLPGFTQWKNTAAESDGYVTGLEPGTDYPNARSVEREAGRLITLEPGDTHQTMLTVEVHDNADGVASVEREIADIQGDTAMEIAEKPSPDLSAPDCCE